MPIKKSELYSSIWKSCDELRGGMDASQYKDYVLVLLFVKYVTDKYANEEDKVIEIPEGGSYHDLIELKGKPNIGEGIDKVIAKLAEANELQGVIDVAYFNDSEKLGSGKEKVDRLTELISIFESSELDFSKNRAEDDDILGDAYEYLMRNFATESGKSKGQFYTPAEVSRVMAKVIGIEKAKKQDWTVYDPTCGSGSLLLKAAAETKQGITIYGQEKDVATRALAKMNMYLHNNPTAEIWRDNTITNPHFKESDGTLKQFDFIVANPPFSDKSWTNGIDPKNDEYRRFDGFGLHQKRNGDFAFLLHVIKSLKSTGKAAIILPHGVLFRGNAEAEIRKNIIKRGYIKGIIGLPANLFYGTSIPACIIVLDKENAENREGIFMINASNEYYKDGNKNRLRERDIHKIVDVFTNQMEIPKYSRLVLITEISNEKNDFNLNIPRYIDSFESEDIQDIDAHLNGGIPNYDLDNLEEYWRIFPGLRKSLFKGGNRKRYSDLNVELLEIKNTVFEYPEFKSYIDKLKKVFLVWKKKHFSLLESINKETKPKEIIENISEDILDSFDTLTLIDKYDLYQQLMVYWAEIMQDDVYYITSNGWKEDITITKKNKKDVWDSSLIPKPIAIKKYFIHEQTIIDKLSAKFDEISIKKETLVNENTHEEDLFSETRSNAGNITKGEIKKRIKEIKHDLEFEDELKILLEYQKLNQNETDLKTKIKNNETTLDEKLIYKYKSFTENEIKELVIEEKWMEFINNFILNEIENTSQKLTLKIKEIADRYANPLPILLSDINEISQKVNSHLERMGYKW